MCSTSANVCVPISVVTAIHNMPFRFSHYSSYPSAFATPELLVSTEVKFPTLRYTVSYVYIMYLNTSGVLGENGLDLRCHLWLSEHLHSTANIHTHTDLWRHKRCHLFLGVDLVQAACGSPVGVEPLLILVRRKETDHTPWNHVTQVEDSSAQLIHLTGKRGGTGKE